MKEDGQYSAIGELDQIFEDSKDCNLNIDKSQKILQSPPVFSMGKCPHHCMGGACMHGFTNVARSMSPIKAGYQCPPEAPKKINNFIKKQYLKINFHEKISTNFKIIKKFFYIIFSF